MIKKLIKSKKELFFFDNGKRIIGKNKDMYGDCSGLRGDIDECDLKLDDRKKGVNIYDLVGV